MIPNNTFYLSTAKTQKLRNTNQFTHWKRIPHLSKNKQKKNKYIYT